ncbi:MAG: NADH-quinone oxidoreductase subunit L [Gammaproteobacteria bacterium]|nr:NADH-quinone oxidoreductase subunit L [Gammaproteobacteria bacterium]MBI5617022.1 NADH-quinone oxidoreductase subunit L [Gammaproteobacteria bacterium]
MENLCLLIVLLPLAGAIAAGLFGRQLGRSGAHWVTILGVGAAFCLSFYVFSQIVLGDAPALNVNLYTWLETGGVPFRIGFLVDQLTATMMVVVTFVSWMVHIYTIGYMHDDPGYQRFFSYISLFTFSMLMLVMANNFLQLFFGWEAVGLVSYLLIGFWFKRESAIYANLKAFLVNRVGDFGFLLGIATVLMTFGSLDYGDVFRMAADKAGSTITILPGHEWKLMTVMSLLLFVGAMGKSAQWPLHVWLPDSMEGPTPISALIHAATMVTAGIFMVARMSPLFELTTTALSVVMIIGTITAFFMGLLGLVQHDIKRVVAYSTLSQLGYMTVALGASAYSAAIFHLFTHAFFKALLFLAAGSVIIGLHHEQDMRHMGGLRKYMPITWITSLIGSLALIGFPGTAGFFSKDAILEAVHASHTPGAQLAYYACLLGVFVTALYSFRLVFLVFHGEERMDHHAREHLHESPAVVTVPLIALAIPSIFAGMFGIGSMVFGDYFGSSIYVAKEHNVLGELAEEFHGAGHFVVEGFMGAPLWFAFAGVAVAWFLYLKRPDLPPKIAAALALPYRILVDKYGFDRFNDWFFAGGSRLMGGFLWRVGDVTLIDGLAVNGSARAVAWWAGIMRRMQSGYLYHYAFAMILGLLGLLAVFVHRMG